MSYLGRRIGLSQDRGDSNPNGEKGTVGGGVLDLVSHGYFERQNKIFNAPGADQVAIQATGGIISDYSTPPGDVYRSHIFTSSGTFTVSALGQGDTVDIDEIGYLVVGGGGAGGNGTNSGGGGGAGGFRTNIPGVPGDHTSTAPFTVSTSPGSYTVICGAGGGGSGVSGVDSQFGPPSSPEKIIALGGGAGGGASDPGSAGGSGGGGGTSPGSTVYPGGASTPVSTPSPWPGPSTQGKAGGLGQHVPGTWEGGGGGGGAGAAGEGATQMFNTAGSGGIGIQVTVCWS